jgi:septum formation protein
MALFPDPPPCPMRPELILASTSRYRRDLLSRLQLPFRGVAPGVDECPLPGESPRERAERLARAKACAVSARHPGAVVIGSDQVASLDGRPLGKPGGEAAAVAQLRAMSGREVSFFTAVALARDGQSLNAATDHTRVWFRDLADAEVRDYVVRDQPLDCAGAFRCEGLGIALFRRIRSDDPTALIGLPLIALAGLLREAGCPALQCR